MVEEEYVEMVWTCGKNGKKGISKSGRRIIRRGKENAQ